MRLFVAVNMPEEERERLHAAAAPLREAGLPVRWVAPESLHITLKFLGEVRKEDLPRVADVVARIAAPVRPFEVTLEGFGAFPTPRRPRVVWAGVDATPQLRMLNHDLEWQLAELGFRREMRAYHPHVTLGRVKDGARAGEFRGFDALLAGLSYRATLAVRTVDLMRSELSRAGARYERVLAAPLGVAASERAG